MTKPSAILAATAAVLAWIAVANASAQVPPEPGQKPAAETALALPATPRPAQVPADGAAPALDAYVYRPAPALDAPGSPVVIALHGCGGLLNRDGGLGQRESALAAELNARGYTVVFPDSFNPRGVREICTIAKTPRPVTAEDRRDDVWRVARWLSETSGPAPLRYALLGWSHGGSTLLRAVDTAVWPPSVPAPRVAFAFYPGCVGSIGRIAGVAAPLVVFAAGNDNWTPPQPCVRLVERLQSEGAQASVRVYEGAVHGFDHPSSRPRVRRDVRVGSDGEPVRVGTDLAARAHAYDKLFEALGERLR